MTELAEHEQVGNAALKYINRLSDVDPGVLEETVRKGFIEAKRKLV